MEPMHGPPARSRPLLLFGVWTILFLLSAALTGYFGLYAAGYFAPAACLLLQAVLLWSRRGKPVIIGITALNQLSGLVLVLVLAFGDALGVRKLDVSAVALLINLATGGPLMGLLSLPLLASLQFSRSVRDWFSMRPSQPLKEGLSI